MLKVNLLNQGKVAVALEVNAKLAEGISKIFIPSSAKASVSGENRGKMAQAFKNFLPKAGKFDTITIETDDEIVTIVAKELPALLDKITDAYNKMEAVRSQLEPHEALYKSVRTEVKKNPKETGKRGRKTQDEAAKYEEMFSLD